MKTRLSLFSKDIWLMAAFCLMIQAGYAQKITYTDAWEKHGFTLSENQTDRVIITHSIETFQIEDVIMDGVIRKNVTLPGTFLFNDAGAPNLPGSGRMIAIPAGSTPTLRIVSQRTDLYHNLDIAPAPDIPLETAPMMPAHENPAIYTKNAFYPASPAILSSIQQIRGIDVVTLGITPFQYNPVTRELIVYRDITVEISFEGGSGTIGENRLRSRWWDPLLSDQLLNYDILPTIDYNKQITDSYLVDDQEQGAEYLIIIPNNPAYARWADSLKQFRTEQGILTKVVTLAEIGGNDATLIENYITTAYHTWTLPPTACLLLGDHGTDATKNIVAYVKNDHPGGNNPYITDNPYADITGNQLPDICFARMTANNESQAQIMVTKALDYERNAPTEESFYQHPIFALGWQTDRWFQICQETVAGYLENVKGKEPVRINDVCSGNPNVDPWSTAINTTTILNFFGPSGLGYIPSTPQALGIPWTGGNATQVNNAIMDGGFLVQHRDHGNYTCWGDPEYCNNNVNALSNTMLPFLMSINCQTGSFNVAGDCLVERFHRFAKNGQNAGIVAGIGDTEVSYSFVNDTYTWGVYDNGWTDFMPTYGTTPESRGFLPCFGNAAGKYFLYQSNWPYNSSMKPITYRLFHFHGDAFQPVFYEVPQTLTVIHEPVIWENATSFDVQANAGSQICLTVEGEIRGLATGTGAPIAFSLPPMVFGQELIVTVTKENCQRYRAVVPVMTNQLYAVFTANTTAICEHTSVGFVDQSTGSPTSWAWTFEGGTPASSTDRFPDVSYDTPGTYSVTLTVTKEGNTDTEVKTDYIHVYHKPVPEFTSSNPCINKYCQFTDLTNPNGGTITGWYWNFGHPASGIYDTSHQQNPVHAYSQPGTYTISLVVTNNDVCSDSISHPLDILDRPGQSAIPDGETTLCQASGDNVFTTTGTPFATAYLWEITPSEAGTFSDSSGSVHLQLALTFTGSAGIRVRGINACGEGSWSDALPVTVNSVLPAPQKPTGQDTIDVHTIPVSDFSTLPVTGAAGFNWYLIPPEAGNISGNSTMGTVTWNSGYRGSAEILVKAFDNACEGLTSEAKTVWVRSTLGMEDHNGFRVQIYPNPNPGKFVLELSSSSPEKVGIQIFHILGTPVYTETQVEVPLHLSRIIDLATLPAGIYYLKINLSTETIIRSVVISR